MKKAKLLAVVGVLGAALALGLLALACGDEEEEVTVEATPTTAVEIEATPTTAAAAGPAEVEVRLLDGIQPGNTMAMELDSTTIPAGEITFVAVNQGQDEHELEVFPYIDGETGEELGEVEEIAPGTSKSLTLDLEPGRYELACKIKEEEESGEVEDHYELGMHIDITVQ